MKLRSSIVHYGERGIDRPSTLRERLRLRWGFYRAYPGADRRESLRRLWRLLREPFLLPARVSR